MCSTCGRKQDFVRPISQRDDVPPCCNRPTTRMIVAPQVSAMSFTGHKGFRMPDGKQGGLGTWIEDGASYHRYLRENGKTVAHEAHQEAAIQKQHRDTANDADLTRCVEQAVRKHVKQ